AEELLGVRQLQFYEVPRIGANFARLFREAGLSADPGCMSIGPGCVRKGFCEAGCTTPGGKNTLCERVLEESLATGNLTVIENATAYSVGPVSNSVYEVQWQKKGRATSDRVVLAAGPLGTVPLLLRSSSRLPRISNSLGN